MALPSLATVADLQARLVRQLSTAETARAGVLLADASAAVRSYTGQQFTAGSSTIRRRARRRRVRLAQRPVTAITSVTSGTAATAISYTWDGGDVLTEVASPDLLTITYAHGYAEIPAEIVAVVCQIAARALGRPADEAGITQEAVAGYSYSTGAAAAAGGLGMLNDERAVLDRYRRVGGYATVGP